ncbi:MAG: GNAT family N-acetyltransferase [Pseudomonadota bacterium]
MATQLVTERLLLRPVDPERDFERWALTQANPDTVRYLGYPPMNRLQTWRHIALVLGHWQILGYGFFSVEDRRTGQWVGRVGHWNPQGWPAPEVGWTIAPDCLRRGYASEAARACVDHAFESLGWSEVSHVILEGNVASARVAEKVGATLYKTVPNTPLLSDQPVWVYRQTREQWQARR